MRPGFPRKYSVMLKVMLFLCPAVELPLIFPISDSLRIPSRSASFFLRKWLWHVMVCFHRPLSPRVREGSYFSILILQREEIKKRPSSLLKS